MKLKLLTLALLLTIAAAGANKYGYYVFIQKCTDTYDEKFESLDQCYVYIAQFYPDFCADLEFIIERSPYYRENCYLREIYVEKMRINKRGKYKRIKHFNIK